MKGLDARPAGHRVILEPGLPPLVRSSSRGSWWTALGLPALHALSLGGTADVSQDRAAAKAHRVAVLKALESQ